MFTKKFLSLVLAMGLAFGFSLNAGALITVSRDVLEIFHCEDEEELKNTLKLPAAVGMVANGFDKLPSEVQFSSGVPSLRDHFITFSETVHNNPSIVDSSDDYIAQRDKVINEFATVIKDNETFKNEFSKIITGGINRLSLTGRSVRGRFRCHPDGETSGAW